MGRGNGDVAAIPPLTSTLVEFIDVLPASERVDIHLSAATQHIIHLRVWDQHLDTSPIVKIHPAPNLDHIFVVLSSWANLQVDREAMCMVSLVLLNILHCRPRRLSVVGLERVCRQTPLPNPSMKGIVHQSWELIVTVLYIARGNVDLRFVQFEDWWDQLAVEERRVVGLWPDEWSNSVCGRGFDTGL